MRIITVDLHQMTKDEARNKLVMTIRNAPQGSVELRVTHGAITEMYFSRWCAGSLNRRE